MSVYARAQPARCARSRSGRRPVSRRLLPLLAAGVRARGLRAWAGQAPKWRRLELRVTRDFGQHDAGSGRPDRSRCARATPHCASSSRSARSRRATAAASCSRSTASSGDQAAEHDWFYYVNGAEASVGAGDYGLSPGDVEQWDFHDWSATMHIPAIVGAYPEPFVHGLSGRRLPTRLECGDPRSACMHRGRRRAAARGVTATSSADRHLGAASGSCASIVAKWSDLRTTGPGRALLGRARPTSGVFARFDAAGTRCTLLDAAGADAAASRRRARGSSRRTRPAGDSIVWLVTGADQAGVDRAAAVLTPAALADAFAVAATPSGPQRLPVGGASGHEARPHLPAPADGRCTARARVSRRSTASPSCRRRARHLEPARARRHRRGPAAGGLAAGVAREQRRWLWLSLPFGAAVVVINALVSQRGLTVVFRGGTLPGGHRLDVTAESLAWGAITALRITLRLPRHRPARAGGRPRRADARCCAASPTARRSPARWPRGSCRCSRATPRG